MTSVQAAQDGEMSNRAGQFVVASGGPDGFSAFRPKPLPPDPPLSIGPELQDLLGRANRELGRLDGVSLLLPDPDLLLYSFVRTRKIVNMMRDDRESLLAVKRTSSSLLAIYEQCVRRVVVTAPALSSDTGLRARDLRGTREAAGTRNASRGHRAATRTCVRPRRLPRTPQRRTGVAVFRCGSSSCARP